MGGGINVIERIKIDGFWIGGKRSCDLMSPYLTCSRVIVGVSREMDEVMHPSSLLYKAFWATVMFWGCFGLSGSATPTLPSPIKDLGGY